MTDLDPQFNNQVRRLHQLTVCARWLLVLFSWMSFGCFGIWGLRVEISLWLENFTWTAVRYGLYFNRLATFCVTLCIGITVAVLVWQSRNIIQGISPRERWRLERQVKKILASGPRHPLWKWVCKSQLRF